MAQIDTYRSNVARKKQEIYKFNEDITKEEKKIVAYSSKVLTAKQYITKTKSDSTIRQKLSEIQRYEKSIQDIQKKIADLNTKIATKQKELNNEENKVTKEQEGIDKKRIQEEKIKKQESERQNREIANQLNKHETLHIQTEKIISEITKLPNEINVLFFAANPIDQNQLRLDEEVRSIMENIRKSEYRDSVNLKSVWATRSMDLLQSINEFNPTIIHFSGHGSHDGIALQDNNGKTKFVTTDAIIQMMKATNENIRVVFFNTCYSKTQAQAVINTVEASIGMNDSIGDEAARIFAAQFYSAIGFGKSIKKAFEQAKAILMLEGIPQEHIPELFIKNGIKAEDIILVDKNN